jgi:hypothetical protein
MGNIENFKTWLGCIVIFFFHFGDKIEKDVKHWRGKVYIFQNLTTDFFMDQVYYNFKEIVDSQVM